MGMNTQVFIQTKKFIPFDWEIVEKLTTALFRRQSFE